MTNILIVGVGGQGTLLASKVIGSVMMNDGLDVKASEVHGMSQRGGTVTTTVRFGEKVYSPIIELGEADYILGFEQMESAKFLPYLKKGGTIIMNTQRINPISVVAGNAEYPQGLAEAIREKGIKLITLDALSFAEEAGSIKAVNLVMLGVLAQLLSLDKEVWVEGIKSSVPEKLLEVNKKAFDFGFTYNDGR